MPHGSRGRIGAEFYDYSGRQIKGREIGARRPRGRFRISERLRH